MKLPFGKVPMNILERHVLGFQGYRLTNVLMGPSVGVDFAVVKINDSFLIVSSDPITGVEEDIGWYAVNVCANDVATSGARPSFMNSVLLLPEDSDDSVVKAVAEQIDQAAKSLRMMVIGGHTEVTPKLKSIIVVTTIFGITKRYVTAKDVKEGDLILMTKSAGIEGTAILARKFRKRLIDIGQDTLQKASNLINQISIVEEAAILFASGRVHAMHDTTEGGILGGVNEMAMASNIGFTLQLKDIRVADETVAICASLEVDPLRLIGSGCLLASVDPDGVEEVSTELKKRGIHNTIIGKFGGKRNTIVKPDGSIEKVNPLIVDELWRLFDS